MPVIPLVEEPDSEELRELYERLAQTMPGIGVLNIFKVMAHNPRVLRDWLRLATPLLTGGLTLVAAAARDRDPARGAGLRQRVRVRAPHPHRPAGGADGGGDRAPARPRRERAVLGARPRGRPLHRRLREPQPREAPDLARGLKRWLSDLEILELSFCVGHWGMLARVLVPLEVPVDEALEATLPEGWREWL